MNQDYFDGKSKGYDEGFAFAKEVVTIMLKRKIEKEPRKSQTYQEIINMIKGK